MTNDELRALADALHNASASLNGTHFVAARKSAAYLRAQADAQPVATLTLLDDMGVQIDFRKSFTLLPGQTFFLYSHPAPASPQAEPIDPHMIVAEDRFPDEPAEPKREPLSDEQIDTALQTYPATLLALMGGEMTVGEFKSALRRLARTVEHAHGISGGGHD